MNKMIMATTIRREICHGFRMKSRLFSTTSIRKLNKEGQEQQDLIVDYLDGDKSGIVVFGLNRPAGVNILPKIEN